MVIGGTQALGEPRYPSLKGIMAARGKEIVTRSLADLGLDAASVGGAVATTAVLGSTMPPARSATEVVRGSPDEGRRPDRRLPGRAEDHLMGALWVVAEPGPDGGLANISAEAATLARELGAAAGRDVVGIVVAADPAAAAADLATYLPLVLTVSDPAAADHAWSAVAAGHVAALAETDAPDAIFVGAGADGRDLAGAVSALTGLGVLVNATAVTWADGGPAVEMSVFGGKLIDDLRVHRRPGHRHRPAERDDRGTGRESRPRSRHATSSRHGPCPPCVSSNGSARPTPPRPSRRPGSSSPAVAGSVGPTGSGSWSSSPRRSGAPSARRGPRSTRGGFPIASRSARPARSSSPSCTSRSGSAARSSTRSGMRTSNTIVAVNRDVDAPIAEFADLFVVGDLFEVGAALLERLRARTG